MLGINLSSSGFGAANGVYGSAYIYPSAQSIDYYASKGMDSIRLPFLWERIQPTKNGPLDSNELARIDAVVDYAASKEMKVILDLHNYGKAYGALVGSTAVPNATFADVWGKLAGHFKADANVLFGLMNEPNEQSATQWIGSVNAAIDAIRQQGANQRVLVPGTYWDAAHSWVSSDNDTVVGQGVIDPIHNYTFEVHQYFDQDTSGTHPNAVSETIGVERLTAITNWARATGNTLFLGEFGAAQDATSLKALDNTLAYMEQNADVWSGATYWAGGPWWGDYMFSVEPSDLTHPVDKPQMGVLTKYDLDASTPIAGQHAPGAVPSPVPAQPLPSTPEVAPSPLGPSVPAAVTPASSSVSITRLAGTREVLNEGEKMGVSIHVANAVQGQTVDLWHANTMGKNDFTRSLAEDLARALPSGVSVVAHDALKTTLSLKEGTYDLNVVRAVARDHLREMTDQASWVSGNQEQTDIFLSNPTGGLTLGSHVVSNWVTDTNSLASEWNGAGATHSFII